MNIVILGIDLGKNVNRPTPNRRSILHADPPR
jgi:hypothetical protein